MRQGKVFYDSVFAGIIAETNDGEYTFSYDPAYIQEYPHKFLTFSMPVNDKVYREKRVFPFFEGLIPEGWLLDIASDSWKINKNDRIGLLLACCKNCIGSVSVEPFERMGDE